MADVSRWRASYRLLIAVILAPVQTGALLPYGPYSSLMRRLTCLLALRLPVGLRACTFSVLHYHFYHSFQASICHHRIRRKPFINPLNEANLYLFGGQGRAECRKKISTPALRSGSYFSASALPASLPRKYPASIKGQMRQRSNDFGANRFSNFKKPLQMDLQQQNGTAVKTETAKAANDNTQNGAATKNPAANAKPQPGDDKAGAGKTTPQPRAQAQATTPLAPVQPAKAGLTLDERLKLVSDLHRKSVQRVNLISRMRQLEAFEIALAQENDELEDNLYQGCKLIIRDDKNREFITSTPGLIRLVAGYIFKACHTKLDEIESTINFPGL